METSPHMETPVTMETIKTVHFQEHVVRYTYKYNQSPPIIQTSSLVDDRSHDVTPFAIKRQYLKAKLHSTHLQRKQQQQRRS